MWSGGGVSPGIRAVGFQPRKTGFNPIKVSYKPRKPGRTPNSALMAHIQRRKQPMGTDKALQGEM